MNHSPQPTALLQSVDTKARGLWSAKKSIKGGSLQTLPPVKTNYIPQTFSIKATVNFYPFLMEKPKDRHWSRASHAAKKMARKEKLMLLIIELLLETFICSLLLFWFIYSLDFCCRIFFLIYAQEKINGPTLYNSLEFWW